MNVLEAKELKTQTEAAILSLLDRYEKETGCLVCDIGFWHLPGKGGVERVEMRVELR